MKSILHYKHSMKIEMVILHDVKQLWFGFYVTILTMLPKLQNKNLLPDVSQAYTLWNQIYLRLRPIPSSSI